MSLQIETQTETWNLTAGNIHEHNNHDLLGAPLDHRTRGPWIVGIAATLTALSFIVVFLRLFTRCRVLNSTGRDDHCILVAMILSIGHATCIILSVVKGDNGKHTRMIKNVEEVAAYNSKLTYAGTILQYMCMGFLRASIVCFLLRLSPGRKLRIVLQLLLGAVVSLAVTATFVTAFRCSDPSRQWSTSAFAAEKKCLDPLISGYVIPSLGLLLNVLMYTVPLPLMWKLELPVRQRIGLIAVFQLGALGILGCVLQLSYVATSLRSADPFWDIAPILIWLLIETHMMMIGSSLPILKALYLHIFNPSPQDQGITELESNERPFANGSTCTYSSPNLPTSSIPRPCPYAFSGRRGSKATQNGGTGLEDPPHLHEKQPQTLKDGRHISAIQTFDPDFFLPTPPSTPRPPTAIDESDELKKSHLTTVLEHPATLDLDPVQAPTPFSFSATAPLEDPDGKRNSLIMTSEIELDEDRVKTAETSFSYGNTDPLPPAFATEPLGNSDEDIRYEPTVPSPAHFPSLNGGFLARNSVGYGIGRNGWGWGSRRKNDQEGRENE